MYLQVKHTSKSGFYLLQQCGIVPSYTSIRRIFKSIAKKAKGQLVLAAASKFGLIVHDNIQIKFPVGSQRGDNQSVSDNGTAITFIVLPESAHAFEDKDDFMPFYRTLRAKRITGTASCLDWNDLVEPERLGRMHIGAIFDILDILKAIPEFDKWSELSSVMLKRPIGPNQLPHGPEHRLEQYMLPTTNIDESSYSGNSQVIPYAMKCLGLDTLDNQIKLALHRRFPWVGDQLSASQCRQIQWFLQECHNGYARWDQCIFIFGGLDMHMALGESILECHRGDNVGATLGSDIILLSRVGLQKKKGKKHDYHTVDEFLLHEFKADFRGLFMQLTGCHTSEELTAWRDTHTANDLYSLASKMLRLHASSGALDLDDSDDAVRHSSIMC
jgi:hypothetical protein